jgi:DNA-binding MarR family transcriptional regulator
MAELTVEACLAQRSPGRMMRRIDKLMAAFVEERFVEFDVSFHQWIALKVVRDGVARNAGELAREMAMSTGATTRMIDVLETRGLLARDRGHSDRRVVQLVITQAGREAVLALGRVVVEAWNAVLVDIDQDEVEHVINGLIKILAAAERMVGCGAHKEAVE